jgi:hypothetical protein
VSIFDEGIYDARLFLREIVAQQNEELKEIK